MIQNEANKKELAKLLLKLIELVSDAKCMVRYSICLSAMPK